jgi:hypothetical protein
LNASVVAASLMASALSASAGVIGGSEFLISVAPGAWFPDVAYDSVDGKYLVVWPDYGFSPTRITGRFVTSGGAVSGNPFPISNDPTAYKLYSAIAYNATNNEFLVSWDDGRGDVIWGQRVRGSDGALLGTNFQIGQTGGIRSAVAWNESNNIYMVVWWGNGEIDGRRVSNAGSLLGSQVNISNDPYFDGYPAISSDNGSQFLVTWDYAPGAADYIRGQRVSAASGANIGSPIDFTMTGRSDRSCSAFDPANSRWMVAFNHPGALTGYDQYGQFVSTNGSLVGELIVLVGDDGFQGDTQFGGDIAFTPLGRYFSSFGTDSGMGGRELLASGQMITQQTVVLGTGAYTSVNNAADTTLNRFLTVWDGRVNEQATDHHVWGRLFEPTDLVPPAPVTSLTTTPGSKLIRLNWTNPTTSDFTGTLILYKFGSPPTGIFDGQVIADQSNTPGSSDSYVHTGLTSGTTYYYAAFAHDAHPNYANRTTASGVPAALGDFEADGDVDLTDFAHLQKCLSGDAVTYAAGCIDADFDLDGDVDGFDVNAFLSCLAGADRSPGC